MSILDPIYIKQGIVCVWLICVCGLFAYVRL